MGRALLAEVEGKAVDEFLTDEQQADRARQWLRENGVFIAAGVILALPGLFGWQQWQDYRTAKAGEAASVWEQLIEAIDGQRYNEVTETLQVLESDYPSTPYLDQARLAIARMHMDRNSPADALEQLETVARAGSDPHLKRVAELRIAQVHLFLGDYDAALAALADVREQAYAGLYPDLRGDIFYAQGQLDDAAAEYSLALSADGAIGIDRTYVQMKLDDISGAMAATAAGSGAEVAEPAAAQPEAAAN